MRLRTFVLPFAFAMCGAYTFAQEDADFDRAAECAGISAAVEAAFPDSTAGNASSTNELRRIAAEIQDNSHRTAYDLGAKAGASPVDVLKRMVSAMTVGAQLPKDQLLSAMKLRCEKQFLRSSQPK